MTRHARREFFAPKLQYFLSFKYIFKYNPGGTNDKFYYLSIISIQRCRIDEFKGERKGRIIVYGLVARYGPQSVANADGSMKKHGRLPKTIRKYPKAYRIFVFLQNKSKKKKKKKRDSEITMGK